MAISIVDTPFSAYNIQLDALIPGAAGTFYYGAGLSASRITQATYGQAFQMPFSPFEGRAQLNPKQVAPMLLLFSKDNTPTLENSSWVWVTSDCLFTVAAPAAYFLFDPATRFASGKPVTFTLAPDQIYFRFLVPTPPNVSDNWLDARGAPTNNVENGNGECSLTLFGR